MSFDEDFDAGAVGAADVLTRVSARRGWIYTEGTEAEDRASIDFKFAVFRQTGDVASTTGQVKYDDRSAETGNVFIETVSIERADGRVDAVGWLYSCQAYLLVIACPERGVLLMPMQALRNDEAFVSGYPERATALAKNGGRYVSRGRLVPFDALRRRPYVTFEAMPDLPRLREMTR